MSSRQGYYRHIIDIQRKVAAKDEFGGDTFNWENIERGRVWANRNSISGRDLIAASAEHSEATVRFYINFRDDITGGMRIVWKGKIHDIVGEPIDIGGNVRELEILTKTGVNEG